MEKQAGERQASLVVQQFDSNIPFLLNHLFVLLRVCQLLTDFIRV